MAGKVHSGLARRIARTQSPEWQVPGRDKPAFFASVAVVVATLLVILEVQGFVWSGRCPSSTTRTNCRISSTPCCRCSGGWDCGHDGGWATPWLIWPRRSGSLASAPAGVFPLHS